MTRQAFDARLCQLSERYSKALDNPKQLTIIRKQLDQLWKKAPFVED